MTEALTSLQQRLARLYGPEVGAETQAKLIALMERFAPNIPRRPFVLSERDAVLITYGDQVQRPNEEPLTSLKQLLDQQVQEDISALHLLPFYPFSSDDGFSVVDYKAVSPRLGSWREVTHLGEHFRLMFDGVINHVSQFSPWFQGFLQGDPRYRHFFIEVDPAWDLTAVVRPRTTPLIHEFQDGQGHSRFIWTTFSKDQVDLNFANPEVLLAVLDALFFYLEQGAVLIRLDAIAFVWKTPGTPCVHLPETHELIQLIREALHVLSPQTLIITETNVPHDENISYFGSGHNEAQMVYNFALPPLLAHSIHRGTCKTLTQWAKGLSLPSDQVCFFNFTASHDGVGLRPVADLLSAEELNHLVQTCVDHGGMVSYRNNRQGGTSPYELNCSYIDLLTAPEADQASRVKRMLLSQGTVLAMPGVPGIYFHSLFGSRSDPQGAEKTGLARSINREKLNADVLLTELATPGHLRRLIFRGIQNLLRARRSLKAMHPFAPFRVLDLDDRLFAMLRCSLPASDPAEGLLVLHNFAAKEVTVTLPESLSGFSWEVIEGKRHVGEIRRLGPYQMMWLQGEPIPLDLWGP